MQLPLSQTFDVTTASGRVRQTLADLLSASERTIVYFYPKDNTPGCTLEAQSFTRLKAEFAALGIRIVGVSKDSSDSHEKFVGSCSLGIDLVSDDGTLCDAFGVMGEKNMYGKKIFGLLRSTFLVGRDGTVLREWRNVKATGHAEKVLREVTA